MTKEYTTRDILNAVDSIQKIKKKTSKSNEDIKDFDEKMRFCPLTIK